jgi:ribosomal protein L13E
MMTTRSKVFTKRRKQRYGKGFSREELKKAGLSLREALRSGIPVDSRRRTAHEENVDSLKTLFQGKMVKAKSRRKSKS